MGCSEAGCLPCLNLTPVTSLLQHGSNGYDDEANQHGVQEKEGAAHDLIEEGLPVEYAVSGLQQFLEAQEHADGTGHDHHHGAYKVALVPYGNGQGGAHEHGDNTDRNPDA